MLKQKKKIIISSLIGLGFLVSGSAFASDWGYKGMKGPAYWGQLSTKYALCSEGNEQSPINIVADDAVESNSVKLSVHYSQSEKFYETNNGHTIKASTADMASYIMVNGDRYGLLQVHFHAPSENQIDHSHYAAEFHFVNQDDKGHLAVLGVVIKSGAFNPELQQFLNAAPAKKSSMYFNVSHLDLTKLLPEDMDSYYTYKGSLTTPPCTEGVRWFVFPKPISASPEQISELMSLYSHNHRPVQLVGSRIIQHVVLKTHKKAEENVAPIGAND